MSAVQILAKEICQTLFDAGYISYFAGGWVRDLILGHPTDEIDIATSAPPKIIQSLFKKTVPVGIAFGVVIIVANGFNFEVTTFRKDHIYIDGRHPEGIDFSTAEIDAKRRDFTINGMFYDPLTDTIYDYVGGKEDLLNKVIRAIGDPVERFNEDKLRMVRAIRFAARFGFKIEEKTSTAISVNAPSLFPSVSIERIWQEISKMAAHPHFDQAIVMLYELGLLTIIFPTLSHLSLEEILQRVGSFARFPKNTPPIIYLMELFSDTSLEERLNLCFYLKTSAETRKIVEFFTVSEELFKKHHVGLVEWVYFYAHPLSTLFIALAAAKYPIESQKNQLAQHRDRQKKLLPHIMRIQNKKPLVTAAHLQQLGVSPGKKMGLLLKKAEDLAINEDLQEPEAVLRRLQEEIPIS